MSEMVMRLARLALLGATVLGAGCTTQHWVPPQAASSPQSLRTPMDATVRPADGSALKSGQVEYLTGAQVKVANTPAVGLERLVFARDYGPCQRKRDWSVPDDAHRCRGSYWAAGPGDASRGIAVALARAIGSPREGQMITPYGVVYGTLRIDPNAPQPALEIVQRDGHVFRFDPATVGEIKYRRPRGGVIAVSVGIPVGVVFVITMISLAGL